MLYLLKYFYQTFLKDNIIFLIFKIHIFLLSLYISLYIYTSMMEFLVSDNKGKYNC